METCSAGGWIGCTADTPESDACDGLDNNCDAIVDEGCLCSPGATRACYPGPSITRGLGACHDGTMSCQPTMNWGPCAGQVLPTTETQDGIDNDCDGITDEP